MEQVWRGVLVMTSVVAVACGGGPDRVTLSDTSPGADGPTWHQDMAPLVEARCAGCHRAGQIGPMPLDTFAAARPWAAGMAAAVEAGTMPPWHAVETDACTPEHAWRHDARLTAAEIALFTAWAAAGAPEGDASAASPLPGRPSTSLERWDVEATMARPHRVEAGTEDSWWCFVLDPAIEEDTWVTGLEYVPGSREVVHHAVLYVDETGASGALAGDDGAYPCFGDVGFEAQHLGAYTPGNVPFEPPEGSAFHLPRGSRLVLEVHYFPDAEQAYDDQTAVRLRTRDTPPEWLALFTSYGNMDTWEDGTGLLPGPGDRGGVEFRIPAGARAHTETLEATVELDDEEVALWGVQPHMHIVGTGARMWVEAADGAERCLVETPAYDFDWQRLYTYDVPLAAAPRLADGDRLAIRCTYDNTVDNPDVAEVLAEHGLADPVDVTLGESSLEEMCLGILGVALRL